MSNISNHISSSLETVFHHQFYKFPDDIVKKIPLHGQHFVGRHWKPTENKPRPEMENENFKPRVEKRFCKGFSNTSIHNKLHFFPQLVWTSRTM